MSASVHVAIRLDDATQRDVSRQLGAVELTATFLPDQRQLQAHLPDIEWLLIGRPPRIDWSGAGKLRLLHVAGSGVDPLFPAVGLSERVIVSNCPTMTADAVRDHVLALLLALARDLPRAFEQQRQRSWRMYPAPSVVGQRVCVVGLGAIGLRVAAACTALGLEVVGVSRTARPAQHVSAIYGTDDLRLAVSRCNYVVLCVPLTSQTRGMFNRSVLEAMPTTAVLVNVARGGIVDETALVELLKQGRLRGAACDVFSDEPLPATSPLWTCPRLLITPHNAGFIPDYVPSAVHMFTQAIERVRAGERPAFVVSREAEY